MRTRSLGALAALTLVLGAIVAAAPAAPSSGVTVKTASVAKLGTVLVNGSGRTLYRFTSDKKGSSSCTGGCASIWPPLLAAGKTSAGTGVTSSKLGTIKRSNGQMQVTYAGYPLYLYAADKAGSDKGEGFDHSWFAVAPSGGLVKGTASAAASTNAGSSTTSSSTSTPPAAPPATTTTSGSAGAYNY